MAPSGAIVTGPWTTDATWCRPGDGAWVAGGTPRRLWRLGPGGRRVADAVERCEVPPDGHEALTRRLVAAGALHPTPRAPQACGAATVAVVIPTRNPDQQALATLVGAVRTELGDTADIVVVDDASNTAVTEPSGARVIRTEINLGPGAARNLGVQHTDADIVVFLDDDVMPEPGWWGALVGHLGDAAVVAVAPRVTGPAPERHTPWWARSEQIRSPLDLGWAPAPVFPGGRVPYVPAAAFAVRREAFLAAGGFDPDLRYGEDVDLVWRLASDEVQVRYEPASVVRHRTRDSVGAWLQQRFHYGTSAASLALRHPGTVVALRLSRRQAVFTALALLCRPASLGAAAGVAGWSMRDLARMLRERDLPDATRWALVWATDAHVSSVRLAASAVWRTWWPVALVLGAASRATRRPLAAMLVITVASDLRWWRRTPVMNPVQFLAARRLDDVAYGAGVWWGCLRQRSWEPLRLHWTAPDRVTQP